MDNEHLAERDEVVEAAENGEQEYELEGMETDDLDEAMREALDAVERRRESLEEATDRDRAEADERGAGTAASDLNGLEAELAELRDRSVRTLADFDNYRKRVARDRAEERRYAAADLAVDILAVVDNLERAVGAEGSAADLRQGVEMIRKQLDTILGRHGVARIAALGEPFDPSLHEAVMREEDAELREPRVRMELQSGYLLHDRLLRPSMVKVAVPVPAAADEDGEPAEPETD